MHLVQLLLPTLDNEGQPYGSGCFEKVQTELTDRFGGVTVYSRAPAEGTWQDSGNSKVRDQVLLFEVMCDRLDRAWWRDYRRELEQRFRQSEIVARGFSMNRL